MIRYIQLMRPLKPQDVMLAIKLAIIRDRGWTQPSLARDLHISSSEINHGLRRLAASGLYNPGQKRVVRAALREFLVFGLRYVFPAKLGIPSDGMPTAFSARPLREKLFLDEGDEVVWSGPGIPSKVRGRAIDPLYKTAPLAADDDPELHEYLALADAMRVGKARERQMAGDELSRRLEG
jgi:hypothetical protein